MRVRQPIKYLVEDEEGQFDLVVPILQLVLAPDLKPSKAFKWQSPNGFPINLVPDHYLQPVGQRDQDDPQWIREI